MSGEQVRHRELAFLFVLLFIERIYDKQVGSSLGHLHGSGPAALFQLLKSVGQSMGIAGGAGPGRGGLVSRRHPSERTSGHFRGCSPVLRSTTGCTTATADRRPSRMVGPSSTTNAISSSRTCEVTVADLLKACIQLKVENSQKIGTKLTKIDRFSKKFN